MATHVYAGVAKLKGDTLGGIFRWASDSKQWEQLSNGLPAEIDVHAITVHPANNDVVFIGTKSGLFRSKDRGAHWQRLGFADPKTQVWSVFVHPTKPDTLFAGTAPVGVHRSDDGGDTWTEMPTPPMPGRITMSFPCRVMRITANPAKPEEMYAAVEVDGTMRSMDGGKTWEDCSADLIRLAQLPENANRIGSPYFTEGMLDAHAVDMSPADPDHVFVAVRMGLFRSGDKGKTWEDMNIRQFSPELYYGRDIRFSPENPRVLYAGLSIASRSKAGSLWRSDDIGKTWKRFDHVQPQSTIMGLALHPKDADQVFMAARLGEVFGTMDGGKSWLELPLPPACQDVFCLACG